MNYAFVIFSRHFLLASQVVTAFGPGRCRHCRSDGFYEVTRRLIAQPEPRGESATPNDSLRNRELRLPCFVHREKRDELSSSGGLVKRRRSEPRGRALVRRRDPHRRGGLVPGRAGGPRHRQPRRAGRAAGPPAARLPWATVARCSKFEFAAVQKLGQSCSPKTPKPGRTLNTPQKI